MNSAGSLGNLDTSARVPVVKRFPRLFKKTNTGAIQYWDIFAEELTATGQAAVVTVYGQLGTPSPQRTSDTVKSGKNAGKANATTAYEQAQKNAKGKWDKQKKKGYVETEYDARTQKLDDQTGDAGIFPMLAQKFAEFPNKVKWPAYIQAKLNGHRCIAVIKDGKATLFSRKREVITGVPHINKVLEESFTENVILDGELFNAQVNEASDDYTGVKTPDAFTFQELGSCVRSKVPKGRFELVEYHVYDMVNDKSFVDRYDELQVLFSTVTDMKTVRCVQTGMVDSPEAVDAIMLDLRALGYEGAMLRNGAGKYTQNKRSYDLLKVKKFVDEEFEITGIEEGSGKLQGHVGSFVCKTKEGFVFTCKKDGPLSYLKEYFEDHSLWQGKFLTVRYANLTEGDEPVPFHGVGIDIRDPE